MKKEKRIITYMRYVYRSLFLPVLLLAILLKDVSLVIEAIVYFCIGKNYRAKMVLREIIESWKI